MESLSTDAIDYIIYSYYSWILSQSICWHVRCLPEMRSKLTSQNRRDECGNQASCIDAEVEVREETFTLRFLKMQQTYLIQADEKSNHFFKKR